MLLIVTLQTSLNGVWITILEITDVYKLLLFFPFWSRFAVKVTWPVELS